MFPNTRYPRVRSIQGSIRTKARWIFIRHIIPKRTAVIPLPGYLDQRQTRLKQCQKFAAEQQDGKLRAGLEPQQVRQAELLRGDREHGPAAQVGMGSEAGLVGRFDFQRRYFVAASDRPDEIAHPVYQLAMSAASPLPPGCPSLP